jgi:hypothetical protein
MPGMLVRFIGLQKQAAGRKIKLRTSMNKYLIKSYEQGFDEEQAHIGFEAANSWLWPLAHDKQDMSRIHSQPNFDPETSWYCFDGNKMVGFISISLPRSRLPIIPRQSC